MQRVQEAVKKLSLFQQITHVTYSRGDQKKVASFFASKYPHRQAIACISASSGQPPSAYLRKGVGDASAQKEEAIKNRLTARLSAAVLAAGITCLYSPYPCFIHAGEPTKTPASAIIQEQEVPMTLNMPSMFHIDDATNAEEVRTAALACVTAPGDETSVDTGFVGDYEEAREVYAASKDWYYGNTSYSKDYIRLADGNVRLLLRTEYGTAKQAYAEHLEVELELMRIAVSFSRTDEKKAAQ